MSSVSKHLFQQVSGANCSTISHPWSRNCIEGSLKMFFSTFKGTAKFYLLMYGVQLIMKNKKVTKDYIKDTLITLIREILFGVTMGTTFVGSNCLFRNSSDKYGYYTISMIPGILGGASIFLIHPSRRGFAITSSQILVLEILYNHLQHIGFKKTIFFETIFFMIFSSGLLYLLRSRKNCNTFLWFFTPAKVSPPHTETIHHPCSHSGTCWKDITNVCKNYFAFGFLFQIVRDVLVSMKRKNKLSISKLFLSRNTYLFGLFTGCYVLIYKAAVCFLCQYFKYDAEFFALPAGFIAGATYAIQPNLTFAVIALTNFLKIGFENLNEKLKLPNFPWQEISFMICIGIVFHTRTMHPHICPKTGVSMIGSMTNKRSDQIYEAFMKLVDEARY